MDWGAPKAYLLSHILGPVTSTPTAWRRNRSGTRSLTRRSRPCCWENGIRHDTTVILYGRNTMAAARAAHLMMYAGVEDVRLLDGGLDAWFVQHLRTETGLANTFAGQGVRRRHSGPSRVLHHPESGERAARAARRRPGQRAHLGRVRRQHLGLQLHQAQGRHPGAKWGRGAWMPTA